jgi:hypothetical protein
MIAKPHQGLGRRQAHLPAQADGLTRACGQALAKAAPRRAKGIVIAEGGIEPHPGRRMRRHDPRKGVIGAGLAVIGQIAGQDHIADASGRGLGGRAIFA